MTKFKDVLIWIFIFVVGSLMVTFLVSPQSFQSFKQNVKSITGRVTANLPYTNLSCKEIAPKNLTILFSYDGLGRELVPVTCTRHGSAKPGENIDVENLFTCNVISLRDGGVDEEGIVQRDYKINYAFYMDDRNCTYLYHAAGGDMKHCNIISLTCNWEYIN